MDIIDAMFETNKKYFKKQGLSYPSIDEIRKGYELLNEIKADMKKDDKTKEKSK
jgi:hypothetical protein